ncbi:RNA-binding protein 25-like isoform X2 [Dermacentor variabilis]|uniref:RNA-binding protein 25-like isoform X2 n=1 Tax=Dermacentor variabilis TaxID=34621 RepID=UPI003F5BBB12
MAFPPHRPPLGMPGMPGMPPMLAPPYTMPHMVPGGMIPMAMMPPMMAHVAVTVPPSIPILAQPPQQPSPQPRSQGKRGHGSGSGSAVIEKKPLVRRNQQSHENASKGPPVTVFVGNITERASDNLIRLILQRCGTVVSWKRVQGANGWLQGFGFCEYGDPESAMRAIRILHDWEIGDKKLVVKVDAKTKEKLDEYKASKRTTTGQQQQSQQQQQPGSTTEGTPAADGANSEAKPQPTDDIDEATWRQDRDTRESILHLLRSHASELTRGTDRERERERERDGDRGGGGNNATRSPRNTRRTSPEPEREYRSSKNHRLMQELDEMDIEEDKRNLITREIDKFRDTYKPSDLGLTVNSWGSFVQRLRRKVAARQAGSAAPIGGLSVKIASYQSASGSHVTHFPVISSLALGDYSDSSHNSHSLASSDMEKQQEEDRDRERERRRERKERRDRERSPDRSLRNREKDRSRDLAKDDRAEEKSSRDRDRDRDREASREPKPSSDSAQPASSSTSQPPPSRSDRPPSKSRSESPERDWVRERERERERELREVMRPRDSERDWEREREEEEEAYERKKLERKLREKEAAYQERLRNWEARERRKAKEYEKERLKEEERQAEEAKEARRLKEFLEDYEDERDDVKYYKGAALQRRMKDREKEIELDNRDRQREREELEDLRRKLTEEGHPDPEAEAKRIHHEEEARLLKPQPHLLPVVRPEPEPEPEPRGRDVSSPPARRSSQHSRAPVSPKAEPRSPPPRRENSSARRTRSPSPQSAPSTGPAVTAEEDGSGQNSLSGFSDVATPQEEGRSMGFAVLKLGGSPGQQSGRKSPPSSSKRKKLSAAASQVFGNAEEEESAETRKKRKLVPLEDEEARQQQQQQQQQQVQHMNTEEKRKHIKSLIDRIPTSKEELFNFNFDRSLVDNALMDKRIRPWINKKIVEYIGEEEPTLVDFICSKVLAGSAAQSILNDVSMVLDEEAEVFVVKMWRLLIYEIEAKKVGLVK